MEEIKQKDSVWKYVSLVILVVLIVGAAVYFLKDKNQTTGEPIRITQDALNGFYNSPQLYPSIGPKESEIVVVEFSDFQCPFCALASGLPAFSKQYASQYEDLIGVSSKVKKLAIEEKIRFVYVPMSFLGDESGFAVEAVLCANEQGKFFEMHDAIFSSHDGKENNGKYSKESLKTISQRVSGIDKDKFNRCLDSGKYENSAENINKASNSAGVSGTPIFFVNGEQSYASWSELSEKLSALGVKVN